MTITFDTLNLREELLTSLKHAGYTTPTPIQAQAIGPALTGRDLLGLAQTGTGKTAAFTLPILQLLAEGTRSGRSPRALILAPTRELAIQIQDSVRGYGSKLKLQSVLVVGGTSQLRQVNDLKRGVDIIIATPGRLEDLFEQRLIDLSHIKFFVLDEADRMLDIGFMPSIKRISGYVPKNRQTLFFSATMPPQVADLAKSLLRDPVRIEVTPNSTPVERIAQHVIFVPGAEKRQVLVDLLAQKEVARAIVFTRTKHGADKVARTIEKAGVKVGVMHGRKSQNARQAALGDFERGRLRVLVATDIAARGIDVNDITHVVNFDLPHEPETYVHRIGRTARAGKAGIAISLCDNGEEKKYLREIEKLTRQSLVVAARPAASGFVIASLPQAERDAINSREPERRDMGRGGRAGSGRGGRPGGGGRSDSGRSGAPSGKPRRPHGPRSEGAPAKAGEPGAAPKKQSWQKRKRLAQGKATGMPAYIKSKHAE